MIKKPVIFSNIASKKNKNLEKNVWLITVKGKKPIFVNLSSTESFFKKLD
jgi:hypothetical protein